MSWRSLLLCLHNASCHPSARGLSRGLTGSYLDMQNNSNHPTASQGPETSESNNLNIGRPSSGSAFGKAGGSGSSKGVQFAEQSFLVRGDNVGTTATTKGDMELLAQNRGNAMQRYMEKKKTRRYGLIWLFPPVFH